MTCGGFRSTLEQATTSHMSGPQCTALSLQPSTSQWMQKLSNYFEKEILLITKTFHYILFTAIVLNFLWFVMDISKNYMPDIVRSTKVAQTTQGLRAVGFWSGTLSTGRTGAGSLFKKSKSLTLWVLSSRQTELGWSRGGDPPSSNCFLRMSILLHLKACLPGWASDQALPSVTPIISSSPLNLCTW